MGFLRNQRPITDAAFRGRRHLIRGMAVLPLIGLGVQPVQARAEARDRPDPSRDNVRALLLSATTLAGSGSLAHARESLARLFSGVRRILLINFASLPEDRDAYAARMQRDFSQIDESFEVDSLHAIPAARLKTAVRDAEAFFVSGGNTFLLLRELYDRALVERLRERVFAGVPYAGSSAGANLAGTVIGTTNDFPLVDVPTRRALGLLPATFNPHHPEPAETDRFESRQWKLREYARYHRRECVIGVNNSGLIRVDGPELTLEGEGGIALIQLGAHSRRIEESARGAVSRTMDALRSSPENAST